MQCISYTRRKHEAPRFVSLLACVIILHTDAQSVRDRIIHDEVCSPPCCTTALVSNARVCCAVLCCWVCMPAKVIHVSTHPAYTHEFTCAQEGSRQRASLGDGTKTPSCGTLDLTSKATRHCFPKGQPQSPSLRTPVCMHPGALLHACMAGGHDPIHILQCSYVSSLIKAGMRANTNTNTHTQGLIGTTCAVSTSSCPAKGRCLPPTSPGLQALAFWRKESGR
jgi:hypothetical protein